MNYRIVLRYLGIIAFLLGASMAASLPWGLMVPENDMPHEYRGMIGLSLSILSCFLTGAILVRIGRNAGSQFFRKEAMAVVSLSWVLATFLGGLPYLFSLVHRDTGVPMNYADALFEAQSGFSTTGSSVFSELEDPAQLPRCILFWRATTHYLGGLGIMVLFVAILGSSNSNAGKVFVRLETTGKGIGPQTPVRRIAFTLFAIYTGLCAILATILFCLGLSAFDAICHSFSVVATGGFSNFNASAGYFATHGYRFAAMIEWVLILFMFIASCNFILLFQVIKGLPGKLFADVEWKTFCMIVVIASTVVFLGGMFNGDFDAFGTADCPIAGVAIDPETGNGTSPPSIALRQTIFQVVSIISTTGLCTDDYEEWNPLSYGIILMLMFVGGCAGSTAGGMKVIRFVFGWKILRMEGERSFRPNVVRPLIINGRAMEREAIHNVLVYFLTILFIAMSSMLLLVAIEPIATWDARDAGKRLSDSISAVASTLNNVGPGFGVIGAKGNYGGFSDVSKLLFVWLMMLGRLEIFVVLSLFHPSFWKKLG
ncbi:MAG TPA: potassium transporter [Planctomycetaceae bacterium]|nr:potassium transporter [Planctomycetaceae bacterium]